MTNSEIAELRGELFGLKVLLLNCLAFQAGHTNAPLAHLSSLRDQALAGIAEGEHSAVRPQHIAVFRAAAAGIVVQATEAASAVFPQGALRSKLQ